MNAPKGLLDPRWKYDDSAHTDIRKRFRRIIREQEAQRKAQALADAEAATKMVPMRKVK